MEQMKWNFACFCREFNLIIFGYAHSLYYRCIGHCSFLRIIQFYVFLLCLSHYITFVLAVIRTLPTALRIKSGFCGVQNIKNRKQHFKCHTNMLQMWITLNHIRLDLNTCSLVRKGKRIIIIHHRELTHSHSLIGIQFHYNRKCLLGSISSTHHLLLNTQIICTRTCLCMWCIL